jgi:hypothetical protein
MRQNMKFPFIWVLTKMKGKRKNIWLGFCGKTYHVSKIAADMLSPLVIQDLYINGECEEGGRCLYFQCPHNFTTEHSLREAYKSKTTFKANPMKSKIGEVKLSDELISSSRGGGVVTTKNGGPVLELSKT